MSISPAEALGLGLKFNFFYNIPSAVQENMPSEP